MISSPSAPPLGFGEQEVHPPRDPMFAGKLSNWDHAPSSDELRQVARLVATPGRQSIRAIISGCRTRATGVYASRKARTGQPWESLGEFAFIRRSEVDVLVVDFQSQPFRLEWAVAGCRYVYIPDCARDMADGSVEIIEIKDDASWAEDPEYRAKLAMADELFASLGWTFRLLTRSDVYLPPVEAAASDAVQLCRHTAFDARHTLAAVAFIQQAGGVAPLARLAEAVQPGPSGLAMVKAMMVARIVAIDLSCPIGSSSEVRLVDGSPRPGTLTFKVW